MLLCVHPSLSLCVCVRALVHVSACIFIVHAWPEAAVLDCSWYGPETSRIIIGKGGIGTSGSVWGRSGWKVIFQILSHRF